MSRGLNQDTKDKIITLMKEGKTTKDISEVVAAPIGQVRSFIAYAKKQGSIKLKQGSIKKHLDTTLLESALEEIEELKKKLEEKENAKDMEICTCHEKLEENKLHFANMEKRITSLRDIKINLEDEVERLNKKVARLEKLKTEAIPAFENMSVKLETLKTVGKSLIEAI